MGTWQLAHFVGLFPAVAGEHVLNLLLHIENTEERSRGEEGIPQSPSYVHHRSLSLSVVTTLQSVPHFQAQKSIEIQFNNLEALESFREMRWAPSSLDFPNSTPNRNEAHTLSLSSALSLTLCPFVLLWWIFIQFFSFWGESERRLLQQEEIHSLDSFTICVPYVRKLREGRARLCRLPRLLCCYSGTSVGAEGG